MLLRNKDRERLSAIFETIPVPIEVWAYGSRVDGTAHEGSDLDLVIRTPDLQKLPIDIFIDLKEKIAESNVPIVVELFDWARLPLSFHTNIEANYEVLFTNIGLILNEPNAVYKKSTPPSEWKTYKLGEISNKIGSGATPRGGKEAYLDKGNYSLVRSQNVLDFSFSKSGLAFITEEQAYELKNVALEENDILLNITGDSVARVCQVPKDVLPARVNQHVAIIRGKNEIIDQQFLKYYLLQPSFRKYMLGLASAGATRNALTKTMIEFFEILAPPLPTQRQIASILTSLDDKIELNLQMNQTLEAMAQAIFKEWFVDFNFPGFDGELVDGLPKGWRMGKLNEMYKTTSGGTPSRAKEEYYENGTINWVKSKELNGSFIFDTEEKITADAVKNSSAKLIPKHSVLVAMYGATVGEYAITTRDTTCNQAICAVIEDGSYPFTYFFEYFKINKNSIIGQASGSAQQNISQALIQQLDILVPPIYVVKKYHSIVESMFIKMENNLLQIQSLTQTRDTLLPKLMSGKMKVSEL
jgi:type I restriction enzyme, S subunit